MQNKVAVAKRDELRLGEVERERRERGKRGRDIEGFKGFKCSFFNFNFYTPLNSLHSSIPQSWLQD